MLVLGVAVSKASRPLSPGAQAGVPWPEGGRASPRHTQLCREQTLRRHSGYHIPKPVVPNLFGPRDRFHGRQFFYGPGMGGWFQDDLSTWHLSSTSI